MNINSILSPRQPVLRFESDDTDVGLVVMYVGAQVSATIEVDSSGDITFKHGALAAEAVDTTIDSGGDDPGVIDTSDTNANTMGEVVDIINASANWKAYLKDALRADASTDALLIVAETTMVPNVTETDLPMDTSVALSLTVRIGSRTKVNGSEEHSAAEVTSIISTNTFGSGTSLIQIYEVDELAKTEKKIWQRSGGATTVEQEAIDSVGENNAIKRAAVARTGMHLIVRMIGSAACTGQIAVMGNVERGA